jgi:hypothetical protein
MLADRNPLKPAGKLHKPRRGVAETMNPFNEGKWDFNLFHGVSLPKNEALSGV